jgi:cell division transport system permease protein
MRLRTINYIFKEGLLKLVRNKLMFFACSASVTIALVILGIFMLLIINMESNIAKLSEIPQIQVYCAYDLGDEEALALTDDLKAVEPGISEFVFVSKLEAFEKAKLMLEEDRDLLVGLKEDFLPASFIVKMESPDMIEGFVEKASQMDGVFKVTYPKKTIDFISKISRWVKIISVFLIVIPMLFAYFIMSNTIKLAVNEQKTEIGVMRYIGATEQLIRWPFVVEGVMIGLIGASIAFIITGHGYSILESNFSSDMLNIPDNMFNLIKIGNISSILLLIYMILGVGVGAVGSVKSI